MTARCWTPQISIQNPAVQPVRVPDPRFCASHPRFGELSVEKNLLAGARLMEAGICPPANIKHGSGTRTERCPEFARKK